MDMNDMPQKRLRVVIAGVALTGLVTTVSFFGGRWLNQERDAAAGADNSPTAAATRATFRSGDGLPEHPDISKPGWAVPYLETETARPLMEGEIGGVRIGRLLDYGPLACVVAEWSDDAGITRGTSLFLDIRGALESASPYQSVLIGVCPDGTVAIAEVDFNVAPKSTYSPLGGNVRVFRHTGQAVSSLSIPAVRWSESEVGGAPAAVAAPILSEIGLGQGAVVTYREGVLTLVHTWGITYEGLLVVAEEVLR
jgi:hypothetical protein